MNNDFVKLGLIVIGALLLFKVLSKYQVLGTEGYDTYAAINGPVPRLVTQPPMQPVAVVAPQAPVPGEGPVKAVALYTDRPQDCFPKDQLSAKDLLPRDDHSKWAQVNPEGSGDLQDQNFITAGYNFGIDTVGQSLRNASMDLRGDPIANPQVIVSPFGIPTIMPDLTRKPLQ